jgi:hypothetical protein
MPLTGAQTVTAMGALPTTAIASGSAGSNEAGGPVVTVILKYKGVTFNPANLLAALTTQYGAGKVASSEDAMNPLGPFNFDITP